MLLNITGINSYVTFVLLSIWTTLLFMNCLLYVIFRKYRVYLPIDGSVGDLFKITISSDSGNDGWIIDVVRNVKIKANT